MPLFVSDLETRVGTYVHPDLEFIDVLNEVLPQLASRGIWKDLTFEKSVSLVAGDRFFTLPEEADAVLYGLANNYPTPVQPLWQGFITQGASSGRLGAWYGVEDAGYIATQEVLSNEYNYAIYAFPAYRWGEDSNITTPLTYSALTGNEEITIRYTNWEGVAKTSTDTLSAAATAQILSPRAVRDIQSVSFKNVTIPLQLVAVPVKHYGLLSAPDANSYSVSPIPGLPSAYNELTDDGSLASYSLLNTEAVTSGVTTATVYTADSMTHTAYGGATPLTDHPCMFVDAAHATNVLSKLLTAAEAQKVATIARGEGIVRYRAFRIHDVGNSLHLLYRRRIPTFEKGDDIVYLDNTSALKYAVLANTAEYNNDTTAANKWWKSAEEELSRELDKYMGAATPKAQFDPSGGLGAVENLQ